MSETTPLVSVLMLTYNHAPYIGQAIESVLNQQTRYPFELIICDDASTDDTREVVRRGPPDRLFLSTAEYEIRQEFC